MIGIDSREVEGKEKGVIPTRDPSRLGVVGWLGGMGAGESPEESSPLTGETGAAEFVEARDELVPGEDGQAGRPLEDGHERAVAVDGQDGDRAAVGIASEPTGPGEGRAERGRGFERLAPEPFDEPVEGMPREPDAAVVALTRGRHRSPHPARGPKEGVG
jgi:hypothetical protein